MTAVHQGTINGRDPSRKRRTAARLPFFQGKVQRKQMKIANEAATAGKPKQQCEQRRKRNSFLTSWMFPIVTSVTRHRRHSVHASDAIQRSGMQIAPDIGSRNHEPSARQ